MASCRLTKIVPNYSPFRRGVFDLISFARFLFVILSLLAASLLPAAEQTSVDSTTAVADELKALRDQTIIQSKSMAGHRVGPIQTWCRRGQVDSGRIMGLAR